MCIHVCIWVCMYVRETEMVCARAYGYLKERQRSRVQSRGCVVCTHSACALGIHHQHLWVVQKGDGFLAAFLGAEVGLAQRPRLGSSATGQAEQLVSLEEPSPGRAHHRKQGPCNVLGSTVAKFVVAPLKFVVVLGLGVEVRVVVRRIGILAAGLPVSHPRREITTDVRR